VNSKNSLDIQILRAVKRKFELRFYRTIRLIKNGVIWNLSHFYQGIFSMIKNPISGKFTILQKSYRAKCVWKMFLELPRNQVHILTIPHSISRDQNMRVTQKYMSIRQV